MPETVIQVPSVPRRVRRTADPGANTAREHPAPRSWAARYGQLILQDGIATVPKALYHQQRALDLIAQEVWFISYLLAYKWQAEAPAPSLKQMARNSGVDLSWLKRLRQRLVTRGYLEIQERHEAHGGQAPNSYDLGQLFDRLETLLAQTAIPANDIRGTDAVAGGGDTPDTAFTARFGRVIARDGIAAVPQALFTYQGALALSPQQVWFVCYILSYQWASDLPYPSLNKMALRTGYSEAHLHEIKNSLIERGYLRVVHRYRASDGGQDNNGYDFSGLIDAINQQLQQQQPAAAPVVADSPAPAVIRRRGQRRAPPIQTEAEAGPRPSGGGGGAESLSAGGSGLLSREGGQRVGPGGGRSVQPGGGPQEQTGHPNGRVGEGGQPTSRGGARTAMPGGALPMQPERVAGSGAGGVPGSGAGGAGPSALIETDQEEPKQLDDSNRHALTRMRNMTLLRRTDGESEPAVEVDRAPDRRAATQLSLFHAPEPLLTPHLALSTEAPSQGRAGGTDALTAGPYRASGGRARSSSYIAGVVLDFSRELGDEAHSAANITQALRLYGDSGQPEQAFVDLLYEARRRTRQYQGRQGLGAIDNKMAYFFRVVHDLVAACSTPTEPGVDTGGR